MGGVHEAINIGAVLENLSETLADNRMQEKGDIDEDAKDQVPDINEDEEVVLELVEALGGVDGLASMSEAMVREMPEELQRMHREASTPLWKGASISVLAFTLLLLNIQAKHGWSDASVNSLLSLLANVGLPGDNCA